MEQTGKFSDLIFASSHILAAAKLMKGHDDDLSDTLLLLSDNLLKQVPYNEIHDFNAASYNVNKELKS